MVSGFYTVQPRFAKKSDQREPTPFPSSVGLWLSFAGLISWASVASPGVSQRMGQVELIVASFLKAFPDRSKYSCQVLGTGGISREEFMLGLVSIAN